MHRLFDAAFYLRANPDVAEAGMDPRSHYIEYGWREGRRPNLYFDPAYYLSHYPDVAASGVEPLGHFVASGAAEGRNPCLEFDTRFYAEAHPEVAVAGLNPLDHFLQFGRARGFPSSPACVSPDGSYVPPQSLLTFVAPLRIEVSPALSARPHLNVLAPGLSMRHMSGGPNTIVALGMLLARCGILVRFVSAALPPDPDPAAFWAHASALTGGGERPECASLVDWHDRGAACVIGENDVFLATAWWTAQLAKYAVRHTRHRRFLYLIQDYETLLHPASAQAALAEETYALDHLGLVNTRLVFDQLVASRAGRYADPAKAREAIVFEPALDPALFYKEPRRPVPGGKRTLLFYARPSYAERNLFQLGVAALQKAVFDGVLDPTKWEFTGIGEHFAPRDLGRGATLYPAPWRDLAGYAEQMRGAYLLLSPMMSPHPSYPPLEMARCGKPVVTTSYGVKTAERLRAISGQIIAVPPTIEAIAAGLLQAAAWPVGGSPPTGYAPTWAEALEGAVHEVAAFLQRCWGGPG